MCHKQAEIEWAQRGASIVACCHSVKLCILAAWAFQSQQSGALTRMWRWSQVQLSHKRNVRQVWFTAKRRGRCCNLSVDVALEVRFITNGMWAKRNTQIYVAEQNIVCYIWKYQSMNICELQAGKQQRSELRKPQIRKSEVNEAWKTHGHTQMSIQQWIDIHKQTWCRFLATQEVQTLFGNM